ncbi:MAG TPA: hypothetical protein VFT50_12165 [Baekduia sp.]|nr:hypothetical protein [Baekduia sp.]
MWDASTNRSEEPDGRERAAGAFDRARTRWGMERVLLLHGPSGEDGDLARVLQRHLRHLPVVMLHDRLLPDGALIEHLAVGPGGVTVIAGLREAPLPLRLRRVLGVFGAHAELLQDGAGADRTGLLTPVRERVVAVRHVVDGAAPVEAALCLDESDATVTMHPLEVRGVLIAGPKAVAALAARPGDVADTQLAELVDLLHAELPPALG